MFPPRERPFRAAALRGLDRALEFATLGEYRLDAPPAEPVRRLARNASIARRPEALPYSAPLAPARLMPASAAARRLRERPVGRRVELAGGVRALALGGQGPLTAPAHRRRGGEAKPGPQPCLSPLGGER